MQIDCTSTLHDEDIMPLNFNRKTVKGIFLIMIASIIGCAGKWSAPIAAPGPVPLGPPGAPIIRLKSEKQTFETTLTEILWDDGNGLVKAQDRVKTITDAAPMELLDRLNKTRKALNVHGGEYDQLVCDGIAVVISLNPDVMVVSVGERKPPQQKGDLHHVFSDWDHGEKRWQIVGKALERGFGYWLGNFGLYAGPLVPWADEMYVFSTDPGIQYQRLVFQNGQAIIPLPKGRLILRRRDIDVDVTRE
jgi:hypothetical protein